MDPRWVDRKVTAFRRAPFRWTGGASSGSQLSKSAFPASLSTGWTVKERASVTLHTRLLMTWPGGGRQRCSRGSDAASSALRAPDAER